MKRSEANELIKARHEFEAEYEAFSIKNATADCSFCDGRGYLDLEPADSKTVNIVDCINCKGTGEIETDEASDSYFDHSGCDICPCGLAGDVYDVKYLAKSDTARRVFDNVLDGQLCGDCLCYLVNGDDSHLDYYVDDEDEADLRGTL